MIDSNQNITFKIGCFVVTVLLVIGGIFAGILNSCIGDNDKITAPAVTAPQTPRQPAVYTLAEKQMKYKAWKEIYMGHMGEFDNFWARWRKVLGGFKTGKSNTYTAYSDLKRLSEDMSSFKNSLATVYVPKEVGEDNAKKMADSTSALSLSTSKRIEAIHKFLEMLDSGNIKPSAYDNVMSTISEGDTFLTVSALNMLAVEDDLKLLSYTPKAKKRAKVVE